MQSCGVSDGVVFLDDQCPCPDVVDFCPDLFILAFSACAVTSFAMSSVTWLDSSEIVYVSKVTDFLSDCVAVAIFASAWV